MTTTDQDPITTPQQRAKQCHDEMLEVLAKHKCRLVPFLMQPRPIGDDGREAIISASYAIVSEE